MSHTTPLRLNAIEIKDPFWQREVALVRHSVLPYQWEALNDRIPDAAPSYWMHNMRAAARAIQAKRAGHYTPPRKPGSIVEEPAPGETVDTERFYGWVFQDSDGYKWLEAVADQLVSGSDPELYAHAQEAISAIEAAQEEDGYLDTYYTLHGREYAFTNLMSNHELYCFGHLAEAAAAWYEATGERRLMDITRRFAACISRRFGPDGERGCPGHEIAEMALFRLYELTGEEEWLKLGCFFLDVRGTEPSTFALEENARRAAEGLPPLPVTASRYAYFQAQLPVRDQSEAVGHAVRQMYLLSGMADAARLTGDEAMRRACERLWHSTVDEKMYVTGGVGATHVGEAFSRPYDLPSDTAYSETCAAIGLVFYARRMLQLQPDSRYADVMELALYNTVLAGMALDGQRFFYVNPLTVVPAACESDARLQHVKPERQKWFGCACCPPNIARLLSSLQAYLCTQNAQTLWIHLYIGCEIQTILNGQQLHLRLDADLLRHGTVRLTILSGVAEGSIALRVPAWTDDAQWAADGKAVSREAGYLIFTGSWQKGDQLELRLSMPVRAIAASPLVEELAGQLCYQRGPIVYCAEEVDNGDRLTLMRVTPEAASLAEVTDAEIAGLSLPALRLPAARIRAAAEQPLYAVCAEQQLDPVTLTLVPYFAWNNRGLGEMRVWLHRQ